MRSSRYKKAFTLIELLVVISIISLLSSVVLSSLNSARDKGRIAAAEEYEASLNHAIGAYAVGDYDFSEGSGSTVHDSSGSGNNAIVHGSPVWSTDTYNNSSTTYSMSFAAPDYIQPAQGFGLANSSFTISEWIKTTSSNGQMYTVANTHNASGYRFGLSAGRIGFLIGNGSTYTESTCGSKTVNDGTWHQIAGVFDRTTGVFSCYIDGSSAGTVAISTPDSSAIWDGAASIGSSESGTGCCSAFVGELDNVRIYSTTMNGVSLQTIYNEEKNTYLTLR